MIAVGLLARNAVERWLQVPPWVKTRFAPGSLVVTEYMKSSGLLEYLEKLGFYLTGYGCSACIGKSGRAGCRCHPADPRAGRSDRGGVVREPHCRGAVREP